MLISSTTVANATTACARAFGTAPESVRGTLSDLDPASDLAPGLATQVQARVFQFVKLQAGGREIKRNITGQQRVSQSPAPLRGLIVRGTVRVLRPLPTMAVSY